jgi:hypothetical protein
MILKWKEEENARLEWHQDGGVRERMTPATIYVHTTHFTSGITQRFRRQY